MNAIRRRMLQLVVPFLAVCLLVYTTYQLLNGEKGIYAWKLLGEQIQGLQTEVLGLRAEVSALQNRVNRLHTPPNPDLMDELARRNLGVVMPNDVVILISPSGYGGRVSP